MRQFKQDCMCLAEQSDYEWRLWPGKYTTAGLQLTVLEILMQLLIKKLKKAALKLFRKAVECTGGLLLVINYCFYLLELNQI